MAKKLLRFSPVIIFLGILVAGWLNRFWLFDSYRLLFYEPTERVSELADLSGMSNHGRRLFMAAKPELLREEEFDVQCQFADLGLVLGCYRSADIFILDVTEAQLEPVEPVTAAHEMLHVVYSRLNPAEITYLEGLLEAQLGQVKNERIIQEIEGYKKDPNSDLYNEMHSIFGTELGDLSPELEAHYAKYFSDRSLVLEQSTQYEAVFEQLESQIKEYDTQLSSLNTEIKALELEISDLSQQISNERTRLDQLLANDQVEQYNAAVPGFNSDVNLHNSLVEKVEQLVVEYNQIVAERNTNVAAKNNLIKSLDSNVEAID